MTAKGQFGHKSREQIQAELDAGIPSDCISTREGGGGLKLDYVSGRYVKERLNTIFGWDGWSHEVVAYELYPEQGTAFAHVRLTIHYLGVKAVHDGMAYGFGRKGNEGFDFAIAEAMTDALKRAAVSMGNSLGLELYPITPDHKGHRKPKPKEPEPEEEEISEDEKDRVSSFTSRMSSSRSLADLQAIGVEIGNAHFNEFSKATLRQLYRIREKELNG